MSATSPEEKRLARVLRLRGPAAPVVRLSRKGVAAAAGLAAVLVAGVTGWALTATPHVRRAPVTEVVDTAAPPPEPLAALPRDYARPPGEVPVLGPPLPPAFGRAALEAAPEGSVGAPGAGTKGIEDRGAPEEALRQARASRLFGAGQASSAPAAPATATSFVTAPIATAAPGVTLHAGTVIKGALLGALRSDVPGPVIAQVTEPLSVDGNVVVPAGSRLLGSYESAAAPGQERLAVTFSRLELADGRSAELAREAALDADGQAGLRGHVDAHWGEVVRGAVVAMGLSAAGELAATEQGPLGLALGRGVQDTAVMTGSQLVGRGMQARPSIAVDAGTMARVILSRDLALPAPSDAATVALGGPVPFLDDAAPADGLVVGALPQPGLEHGGDGEEQADQREPSDETLAAAGLLAPATWDLAVDHR